jgi:hypothetical protein
LENLRQPAPQTLPNRHIQLYTLTELPDSCTVLKNFAEIRYTTLLNHPRGWGGKPIGSLEDSRVAELSQQIIGARLFVLSVILLIILLWIIFVEKCFQVSYKSSDTKLKY